MANIVTQKFRGDAYAPGASIVWTPAAGGGTDRFPLDSVIAIWNDSGIGLNVTLKAKVGAVHYAGGSEGHFFPADSPLIPVFPDAFLYLAPHRAAYEFAVGHYECAWSTTADIHVAALSVVNLGGFPDSRMAFTVAAHRARM